MAALTLMDDETLALRAQAGDQGAMEALVARHRSRAEVIARTYVVVGAGLDLEDRVSYALAELVMAVRSWRPDGGAKFLTHAKRLMTNGITDAVRRAAVKRAVPWNRQVSLDAEPEEEGEVCPFLARAASVPAILPELFRAADAASLRRRRILGLGEGLGDGSLPADDLAAIRRYALGRPLAQAVLAALDPGERATPSLFGGGTTPGDEAEAVAALVVGYVEAEWEVLVGVAAGDEPAEIADRLGLPTEFVAAAAACGAAHLQTRRSPSEAPAPQMSLGF